MGWADDQIRKERSVRQSQNVRDEMALRAEKIKDECGSLLFSQVTRCIRTECAKYNAKTDGPGLHMAEDSSALESTATVAEITSSVPSFSVQRKDGLFSPLDVRYLSASHAIVWKLAGTGSFHVHVNAENKCYLTTDDETPITPEAIATLLLSKLTGRQRPIVSPYQ